MSIGQINQEGPGMGAVDRGETLTDQVYARLRHGLLMGLWQPGEKITARQIGKDLGVSLTPAREAMMRLASEGALDVSVHRTFSAAALDVAQYREIAAIRIALEPIAARAAALLIPEAEIGRLADLNERMKELNASDHFREALQLDSEFHLTIYDHAAMPTLRAMIDSLWLRAGPTRNRLSHAYRRKLVGYGNHQRIIDALRRRDADAVAAVITEDLDHGTRSVIAVMSADA